MNQTRKSFNADFTFQPDERGFVARITSRVLDREDEVLLPEGLISTEFEKNPVVFWNHDYDKPIGTCKWLRRLPDAWLAHTELARRPENHQGAWLPDTVLSLARQGVVRGVSVGFLPVQSREPSDKDRQTFGPAVRRVITRWRMLEFSVTPLPANQDALILAVAKGLISRSDADALMPPAPTGALQADATARHAASHPARRRIDLFFEPAAPAAPSPDLIGRKAADAIARRMGKLYRPDTY